MVTSEIPRICIAGKNEIAVHGLELALKRFASNEIVVCANKSDDGVSRWQPSLKRFAKEWHVDIVSLEDLYRAPDIIFLSLEFDRIIRPNKFQTNNLFNIHFSLLPAYRGMYTSAWPILNGEAYSGVTLHRIDSGIDTGDIIYQEKVCVRNTDTCRDLYLKYLKSGMGIVEKCFDSLVGGGVSSYAQPEAGSSYYSMSSINYNNLMLEPIGNAESIVRKVRAYHFREYQIPEINGFPLCRGRILPCRSRHAPGTIVNTQDDLIEVSTSDYDVQFDRDRSWEIFNFIENDCVSDVELLACQPIVLNRKNVNGWTPLIVAAYIGKNKMCRALIEAGSDIDKPNKNGTTPLMYAKDYAIRTGDWSICRMLLNNGADMYKSDRFGKTVFDYVKNSGNQEAIYFFGKSIDVHQ